MRRAWLVTLSAVLVLGAQLPAQRPADSLADQTWTLNGVARTGIVAGPSSTVPAKGSPLVLELAHCTLQQFGYRVLPCSGADEALRTLASEQMRVHLLVTDVVMPRMNGIELASRIRSLCPGIAVLYTSGYGESIIATQGVLDDGVNFIGKPYRPVELALKVRSVLDREVTLAALDADDRAESGYSLVSSTRPRAAR